MFHIVVYSLYFNEVWSFPFDVIICFFAIVCLSDACHCVRRHNRLLTARLIALVLCSFLKLKRRLYGDDGSSNNGASISDNQIYIIVLLLCRSGRYMTGIYSYVIAIIDLTIGLVYFVLLICYVLIVIIYYISRV